MVMQGLIIAGVLMVDSTGTARPEGPEPAPGSLLDTYFAPADRPPAPQWRGRGLLIGGGLLGGLGLITNVVRIGMAQGFCKDLSYDFKTVNTGTLDTCVNSSSALLVLSPTAFGLNAAAFGLVAGGASVHGRHAAYETIHEQGRRRRGGVQLGVGAGLMTAAIAGYVITRIVSFGDVLGAQTCLGEYPGARSDAAAALGLAGCVRSRWSGYLAGITVTQAASIIGVGVFAHGAGYRRHMRLYRKARAQGLRVHPSFSPTWAGLSLSGRF